MQGSKKHARLTKNSVVSLESITKRFVDLGLSEEEAQVLKDLYLSGEAKAGDLAKASGLSRINVYRALERLQKEGIVEASMGRPVIFSAIPPEMAAQKLVERASSQLRTMQQAKEQVIKELSMFKLQQKPQAEAKYRIVQGKQQIYSWIGKMASAAKSEVLAYIERDDLRKIYYTEIIEELAKARKRGARVMILTDVDYSLAETVENYAPYAEIRHTRIPGMSVLLVVDESELAVSAMTKSEGTSDDDVALWMNGKNFVAGIKGLLRDSWENATDAQTRINIMKEGGKALQDMLVVKGQQQIAEFCHNMVARAKKQVLHVSIPYDRRFFEVARGALKAGAQLRVLTSVDAGSLETAKKLHGVCEIRHIDASAGLNVTLVDGEEVLITPALSGQSAIWSSLRDYVDHYRATFEGLWSSATPVRDRIAVVESQAKAAGLVLSMRKALEEGGFSIGESLKGTTGLVHRFSVVAQGSRSIVIDIASPGQDPQSSLIGFIVKCMDVRADHKLLVTLADPAAISTHAGALGGGISVAGADEAVETLGRLVAPESVRNLT